MTMFESDDFDQILSQLDLPEDPPNPTSKNLEIGINNKSIDLDSTKSASSNLLLQDVHINVNIDKTLDINLKKNIVSPKLKKRKMISSLFDHQNKRRFPGPAGLLVGNFKENEGETISHMELSSQDLDYSQNHLQREVFDTLIWKKLLNDIKVSRIGDIDSIIDIKQQALAGNLRQRKAKVVTGFIETIDRSVTDPLITLRDKTGKIKCTLHRDAWSIFSPYIMAEFCAIILLKPTVLTTGNAIKKHYLNITLSNIYAIYSSGAFLNNAEENILAYDGYISVCEDGIRIVKTKKSPLCSDVAINEARQMHHAFELSEDLDSLFSDDIF